MNISTPVIALICESNKGLATLICTREGNGGEESVTDRKESFNFCNCCGIWIKTARQSFSIRMPLLLYFGRLNLNFYGAAGAAVNE